jgi:hypothetical protein
VEYLEDQVEGVEYIKTGPGRRHDLVSFCPPKALGELMLLSRIKYEWLAVQSSEVVRRL